MTDFCHRFIGQKSVKKFVGFLGDLKTTKFHSQINWPLTPSSDKRRGFVLHVRDSTCLHDIFYKRSWRLSWVAGKWTMEKYCEFEINFIFNIRQYKEFVMDPWPRSNRFFVANFNRFTYFLFPVIEFACPKLFKLLYDQSFNPILYFNFWRVFVIWSVHSAWISVKLIVLSNSVVQWSLLLQKWQNDGI